MKISLRELNASDQARFIAVAGPLFEHSPWIAERTWPRRPFATRKHLHDALCAVMRSAPPHEQVSLIAEHPDLVGRAARAGTLTSHSQGEQAAAGLDRLTAAEIAKFNEYNAAYRDRFGFPFVICARENKKESILAAIPARLLNSREQEIATALDEIARIAWFRLLDAIDE